MRGAVIKRHSQTFIKIVSLVDSVTEHLSASHSVFDFSHSTSCWILFGIWRNTSLTWRKMTTP